MRLALEYPQRDDWPDMVPGEDPEMIPRWAGRSGGGRNRRFIFPWPEAQYPGSRESIRSPLPGRSGNNPMDQGQPFARAATGNRPESSVVLLARATEEGRSMERMAVSLFATLFALLALSCGGNGGPTGGCSVDCSNWTRGTIDVKDYTFVSRDECINKARAASCPTKWCNYSCENSCCENVH